MKQTDKPVIDLMSKRWKCINKVPFHSIAGFKEIPIGYIFEYPEFSPLYCEFPLKFDDYPHLFQPLPWWSDREVGDLPEYIKYVNDKNDFYEVVKVSSWEKYLGGITPKGNTNEKLSWHYHSHLSSPATFEEFNTYNQK